ncbi:MAG TPA: hypothetical protein VMC10_16940 [Stellaceae bacterium]|nr:hypothetical protein [Stellaceae bacterium]
MLTRRLHRKMEAASATFYDGIYGPLERRASRASSGDVASAWAALLVLGASFFTVFAG